MANPYEIPWTPPNIIPGASFLLGQIQQKEENARAEENAKTQRMFAENTQRRESAAEKRQSQEYADRQEEKKLKRKIDQANALEHASQLIRSRRFGEAQAHANAYGIDLHEAVQKAAADQVKDEQTAMPTLLQAAMPAQQQAPATELPPVEAAPPEPQNFDPEQGAIPPAEPPPANMVKIDEPFTITADVPPRTMPPTQAPQTAAPMNIPPAQPAPRAPTPLLYQATMNGQTYDIGGPGSGSTGLGEQYDKMLNGLIDAGYPEKEARAAVLKQHHDDTTETGKNQRLADAIAGRDTSREEHEKFLNDFAAKYNLTAEQKAELAHEANRSRVAAAGPGFKQEGVNDRVYSLLDRRAKSVRDTGLFQQLAKADQTQRALFINIADGTLPLQHRDAQIQLARIFRQAQPTEGEMHLLYNNLGGTLDKWNQFLARIETGDLSAEQMRQLKASATAIKHEHEQNKARFIDVARSGLGPGSGLDMIPDQAQSQFDMMAAELGYKPDELPPLYSTEGGVTLGSKSAPSVKPRAPTPSKKPAGGKEYVPGKVGPHGRPVYREGGKLFEED